MATLKRLARYFRLVSGQQSAARGLTVYPDDTFLVSFPKSGNTWARFLVTNLGNSSDPTTFTNLESRIPEIYDVPDRVLRRFPRPRIIRSHECFDPRYKKVVYIVRDPRDVAVSYYEFQLKRRVISDQCSLEQFVPRFMAAEIEPKLGSWSDHLLSWLGPRQGSADFLLLRYEDMKSDPHREATRIAAFLGLDTDPGRVANAVQLSSFDRMRGLEQAEAGKWKETKGTRQDKPFVRKAMVGGWRSALPERSVAQIESTWGGLMRTMGYESVTRAPQSDASEAQAAGIFAWQRVSGDTG